MDSSGRQQAESRLKDGMEVVRILTRLSVENLDVQTLSAIVANLGICNSRGLIKSKGGHFYINVSTGEIVSKSSDGTISVFVKKENIDIVRSFTASRYWGSRLNYSGLEFYSGGSSMADDIANGSIVCSIRGDEEMRDFSVTNINGDSIWLIRTIKQLAKSISYGFRHRERSIYKHKPL